MGGTSLGEWEHNNNNNDFAQYYARKPYACTSENFQIFASLIQFNKRTICACSATCVTINHRRYLLHCHERERERERERKRARERERYVRSRKFESRDHKNPVCDHTERLPKLSLLSVCKCTFHYCKVSLKLNGYTLRGSDFAVFIFAPPPSFLQRGQLIKKRICSYWSKFFSLGVDPFWKSPSFR